MSISARLARHWPGAMLLALAMTVSANARADDGLVSWIVKSVSSDEDGAFIPTSAIQVPQIGAVLAAGQRISTAAGQRMVLVNGRDLLDVMPNTTLTIGDDDPTTPAANLDLVTGTIHLEVGKRAAGKTFSIGAPYLVATVKGTRFNISSLDDASAVSVTEGIVAVSSVASGRSVDVTPGNTAIVRRGFTGAPSLAPTPASGAPSSVGTGTDMESASAGSDNNGGSSDSSSGGPNSGGSTSGSGGIGGTAGAVGDTTDKVGGAVGGATGAVGDAVGGAVGGAVSDVGGAVGGAISDVGGAVDNAGKAVGGLLGGGNK